MHYVFCTHLLVCEKYKVRNYTMFFSNCTFNFIHDSFNWNFTIQFILFKFSWIVFTFSWTVFGPQLYNSLPKYLRDIESVKTEKFKFELDKFLELIPGNPKCPTICNRIRKHSILDQLTHLRAQLIYKRGGVLDSAVSSLSFFETTPSIQVNRWFPWSTCSRLLQHVLWIR